MGRADHSQRPNRLSYKPVSPRRAAAIWSDRHCSARRQPFGTPYEVCVSLVSWILAVCVGVSRSPIQMTFDERIDEALVNAVSKGRQLKTTDLAGVVGQSSFLEATDDLLLLLDFPVDPQKGRVDSINFIRDVILIFKTKVAATLLFPN